MVFIVLSFLFCSIILGYLLLACGYSILKWLDDDITGGILWCDDLRKIGFLGYYDDDWVWVLFKSFLWMMGVITASFFWIVTIPVLFIIAMLHGLRAFKRFKKKVNRAINKKEENV